MVMELPPHQPAATQRRRRPRFGRVLPASAAGNPGKVLGKGQQDLVLRGCARPALETLCRLPCVSKAMVTSVLAHGTSWDCEAYGVWGPERSWKGAAQSHGMPRLVGTV